TPRRAVLPVAGGGEKQPTGENLSTCEWTGLALCGGKRGFRCGALFALGTVTRRGTPARTTSRSRSDALEPVPKNPRPGATPGARHDHATRAVIGAAGPADAARADDGP